MALSNFLWKIIDETLDMHRLNFINRESVNLKVRKTHLG